MMRNKIMVPEPDSLDVAHYRIKREPCMDEALAASLGSRGYWWVRSDAGTFVNIWPRARACEPLDIEVTSDIYTIGAGGPEHYRETLDLLAPPGEAPCASMRCSGMVPFTVEVELDRFEDGAQPPRSRLCSACLEVSP